MKRIVVCADGTWNRPDEEVCEQTNVAKIYQALCGRRAIRRPLRILGEASDGVEQIVFYHAGVRTHMYDQYTGIFGFGLNKNIMDCYRVIAEHYELGDEIYLFGFSRGAYTVRSLGGLLARQGIPTFKEEVFKEEALKKSWNSYRNQVKNFASNIDIDDIACIGVWDTVGSLGIPNISSIDISAINFGFIDREIIDAISTYQFHDVKLSPKVKCAFHAVALDERRRTFLPTLWEKPDPQQKCTFAQEWFRGVHSDIGGGYVHSGLSDITLEWMINCVSKSTNLQFSYKNSISINPDSRDRLHDEWHPCYGDRVWREIIGEVPFEPKPNKSTSNQSTPA